MTASTLNIRRVTDDSPASLEPIVDTVAEAFDDHIARAVSGDDHDLRWARMRASVVTTIKDLECYVASLPGSDRVDCVMLVKPPGMDHGVSPNATGPHTEAVAEMVKDRPGLIKAVEQIKKAFHDVEVMAFGPTTVRNFYYISHLATAPSAAGKGIGGQMLKWMIAKGKAEGVPVTLLTMTERHVKYYERYGFVVRADMPADLNGTPTHWWAMSTAS